MTSILIPQNCALLQGVYYLVTGIWPLLHMPSFVKVTGPKVDLWLVRTVGLMITASSIVFLYSSQQEYVPFETMLLAIGNALGLMMIDIYYSLKGRISRIYLLDAVPEAGLILLWLASWLWS